MNHNAIYAIYSNVVSVNDNGAFDAQGKKVEIDIDLVNAWKDPEQYKDQRAAAYPSFADQFDLLYHGGIEAWKAAIQSVKDKYPKE